MGRRLIVILIILLPLRAWAGDWMALAMLHGPSEARMTMPDCPGHTTTDETHADDAEDCCDSCELCLPLAQAAVSASPSARRTPDALPVAGTPSFLSADPAPDRKPPRV